MAEGDFNCVLQPDEKLNGNFPNALNLWTFKNYVLLIALLVLYLLVNFALGIKDVIGSR